MSGYAWVTLATNDSYSLGALVLAHSLKKCNTIHKLAVLITPAVSQSMRQQLQSIFDVVKLVDVLDSKDEAHLALLKRPELGITFTKIHCWKLTEFEKCVFLDADTLVVRNCDELFEREEFSAAPDVSWPDCFNSGVFVYKPSVTTFNEILQYAVEKGSFDGGDQGLLNQYFGKWATEDIKKHLPFVYNLTTIAAYAYIPAFKHYGSETRIVHFIGAGKPWLQKLDPTSKKVTPTSGSEHLTPLLQKWWDLFSENVHPKLDKSVDFANGMSPLPVEACSNHFAVEPETPDMLEPLTSYREPNDFRQFNLPYSPVVVKDSSGKPLSPQFLPVPVVFSSDQNNSEEEQQRGKKTEVKTEIVATFEKGHQNDETTFHKIEERNQADLNCLGKSSFEFHRKTEINETNFFESEKKNQSDLKCVGKNFLDVVDANKSTTKTTEISEICDLQEANNFRNENTNDKNEVDPNSEEMIKESKEETEKEDSKKNGCDDCYSFVPDEICINNYLENNVEVYQPFQNRISRNYTDSFLCNKVVDKEKESSQFIPPLPRFLTIPESDKRQSGNCSSNSLRPSPPVNKFTQDWSEITNSNFPVTELTTDKFEITNLNITVNELTTDKSEVTNLNLAVNHMPIETHHNNVETEASNVPAETKKDSCVQENDVKVTNFFLPSDLVTTQNQKYNFLKSKSLPNLEIYNILHNESSTAVSSSAANFTFKNFVRKYSLPKLKPLLPRQNSVSKIKASSTPKITYYTEFLISSEYKEPVDLPKDKIGFMESHISSIRQKSNMVVGGKFGPVPPTSLVDINECLISIPKKPFRQLHNEPELYDLKTCKRQLGNQPKENSSKIDITPMLPALKPLVPYANKKLTSKKRRKSKELSFHLEEKRMKKENEALKDHKRDKRSIISIGGSNQKTIIESSSTDEILKRLFNFSKDYLHYFGKENDKHEADKRVPFQYEDYEPLELKRVIGSTCSNLRTKGGVTSEKVVFSGNFEGIPADVQKVDKNISNKKCITSARQKQEKDMQTNFERNEIKRVELFSLPEGNKSEILMCKEKEEFNVKPKPSGSENEKFFTSPCTEIVLLRTAKIWRKKFQKFLDAIYDDSNKQVRIESIIPLPWPERDVKSNEDFVMKPSEVIRQNSSTKYGSKIGVDDSKKQFAESSTNENKSQDLSTKDVNSAKGFVNYNSGSKIFSDTETEAKESENKPEAPEAKNPMHFIKPNDYFSENLTTAAETHKNKKFNETVGKVTATFDDKSSTKQQRLKEKNKEKKMGKASYLRKETIKKQIEPLSVPEREPLCVPDFETPRSSRVDFTSEETVSDILNEKVMAPSVLSEKPLSVVSEENPGTSSISQPNSYKTPPPRTISPSSPPSAKRNERLNPKKKCNSNGIPSDNSPDETFHVVNKKATNRSNKFAGCPTFPYRVCIDKDTLEAVETKHEFTGEMPKPTTEGSGIAGSIAQLNLGSEDRKESSEASSSAYQEYLRRQNWETGNMDYMGKDSFDNIWSKICENLNKKTLEDLKGNMEVLKQKAGVPLENQTEKLQSKSEKESVGSGKNEGMSPIKSQPEKQKEVAEKEILPNVEKTTVNITAMNQPEETKSAQISDKQVSSPVVQPNEIASQKEPAVIVSSNVSGTDAKLISCKSSTLPKTPSLSGDTKSAPVVQPLEAKVPQPVTPSTEKTSKPPLITETPPTPISEKKAEDEPKLVSPAAQQQKEPQKASPATTGPSEPINPDAKTILPDSQTSIQSDQSKQEVKPISDSSQILNATDIPGALSLDIKSTSSSQITPTAPTPESKPQEPIPSTPATVPSTTPLLVTPQVETKTKEPLPSTPTTVASTTPLPVTPQTETKPKEQIISTPAATTLAPTSPTPSLPTSVSAAQPTLNLSALAEPARISPTVLPDQPKGTSITSTPNTDAKASPLTPSLAAAVDSSKTVPSSEPVKGSEVKSQPQPQAAKAAEPSTNKSSSETIKQECSVKLSDILQPKGSAETEMKDKAHAQTQEQGKNTAVVPYCDVLKQAQGPEEKEKMKEKEKPKSQKSIEELKKRQSEFKTSQLPPIPLPESPVKTQPELPKSEEKNELSQPASQQVTSEESKDPCPKTSSEGSLKDNGKQKKGMFSKILEIVGVSPKEKKEDETESSKSVFYDCEGIPPAEKKQDLITNESSIKTVSEVPEKPVADTSKRQGEITTTKANEEGVPTSKPPPDEAKTTNTDKSKDVNCDKKKPSNMLQSETATDRGNKQDKQDKQKNKETQPKQEDSQSGNKKNKGKPKPPRNTAPSPSQKAEEPKQPDNKDKKKESPNSDLSKTTQKQEPSSKAAEVLPTPSTEPKEAKDSSVKQEKPELMDTDTKVKEDLEKKSSTEGKIKSDLDEILNKAKTEVEARMQEKKLEGSEGLVPEVSEVNTMKLIVGENNKTENQAAGKKDTKNAQQNKQKPQKDGKFNKRGPQGQPVPPSAKMEEIEEVKVTSEEDRKKHKGQVTSSKLSDQILKAIPPPRRKAISDAKGETQESNATSAEKPSSEVVAPSTQQQPQLNSASDKVKQPDVAKPQQPDVPKPQQNDVPKPQQPDVPKSQQPDVPKSQQPDVPKPQQPNVPKPQQNDVPKPQQPDVPKPQQPNVPKPQQPNVPKPANPNQSDGKKGDGKTKSASGPVPPPRNRSKPRQPTPPKNKSKK